MILAQTLPADLGHLSDLGRLLMAAVAGALIGFERELHDKPAGFRTNILICVGAALFTLLSVRIPGDRAMTDITRIAAQVVTGVGFLGAGAIIRFRGNVIGLTTAATIWAVASVGMAFGAGAYLLGCASALLVTAVLVGLGIAEDRIAAWRTAAHFEIQLDASLEVSETMKRKIREHGVFCRSWTITKAEAGFTVHASVVGPEAALEKLQTAFIAEPHVQSLRRL